MTKLRYIFFFIFTIPNTPVSLIFHAECQPKIFCNSGEKVDFVVFVILVTAAILDIRPDPILQF